MDIVFDQCIMYSNGKRVRDVLYIDEKQDGSIKTLLRDFLQKSVGIHVAVLCSDVVPSACEELFTELKNQDDCEYICMKDQIIKFKQYRIGHKAKRIIHDLIFRIQKLNCGISINEEIIELINFTQEKKLIYTNQFAKRWDADTCDRINQCFVYPEDKCVHILIIVQETCFRDICSTEEYVFPEVVEAVVHCTTKKDRRTRAERAFRAFYEQVDDDDRAKMKNTYLLANNSSLLDGGDNLVVEMDTGARKSKKTV